MIWVFIILSGIWFGFEILDCVLPMFIDPLAVAASSVPVGFTLTAWVFVGIRTMMPLGVAFGVVVPTFLCLGSLAIHYAAPRRPRRMRPRRIEFVVLVALAAILLFFLVGKSILKHGTLSSGTVFSDLPFHLGLISTFAYGANSYRPAMMTPFYAGERLSYPMIPDFFSAVLVGCGGASLRLSIAVPTLLVLMSLVVLLHFLASFFSGVRFVPELAVFCFIFASGVGWRYLFVRDCRTDPNANMSHCFCQNVFTFWIHALIHFLLPQRSGLFSLPIVLLITIILLYVAASRDRFALLVAGALMGLLPMISAHSFIAIGEYALFICACQFPWRARGEWISTLKFWAIFGGAVLAVGIPQIVWLLRVPRIGFLTVLPIWLETFPHSMKVLQLWWDSLGAFVFLALFAVWASLGSRQKWGYIPSIGVFVLSNFVRYQPGAMDNNKVFFAGWYPLACCAVAHFLVWLWSGAKPIVRFLTVWVVIGFSTGSVVTIWKALRWPFPLFTRDEKELGLWVMENTPKTAVFLGSTWHSNPTMSIGGRLITMGYGGWVWTHGLSYDKRNALMHDLIANRENVSKFLDLNIRYAIARGDDNTRGYEFPAPHPQSRWILLVDLATTRIYRLLQD
jgi:hypothetical protein